MLVHPHLRDNPAPQRLERAVANCPERQDRPSCDGCGLIQGHVLRLRQLDCSALKKSHLCRVTKWRGRPKFLLEESPFAPNKE